MPEEMARHLMIKRLCDRYPGRMPHEVLAAPVWTLRYHAVLAEAGL